MTATKGNAITASQSAEHAAGPIPFSSPAQPLHLPDMGMPDMGMPDMGMPDMGMPDMGMLDIGMLDIGRSFAATTADLSRMSGLPRPCATSPTAKTKAASKLNMRRSFFDHIQAE
jgi:hypothetical protein